ncbi:putative toxin-antitoxin system toxin component, PIN family [Calothrix sp. HK-06]|nr:putative toxin-antitoxin system toxin component, PIN family [Calothrix sp. HK-06]
MAPSTIRVIFDTNIYFALVVFKNPALKEFFTQIKTSKRVQIIYSGHIRQELIRNLEEKQYKFSPQAIDNLFKGMEEITVTLDKRRQPQTLRDHDDWHLFALAHFSEAHYLVSGDGDILALKPKWGKTNILTLREFSNKFQQLITAIDTNTKAKNP